LVACPSAVRSPERHKRKKSGGERTPEGKISKTKTKRRPTFNLLLLHLESAALGLDRLLQADDGGALLLERPLLVRVRDAEGYQLAVEPRDINILLLQRLRRRLASGALLLELALDLLAGGTLLPELFLRRGKRGDLGVEGGF
jgi:hypothetical protein